jgi:hypothetical protein
MLWLALYLDALPLEAWQATAGPEASAPDLAAAPAAVASPSGNRTPAPAAPRPSCVVETRRVVLADPAARAAGVEPGMSAASAASLVAGLHL